MLGDKYVVPEEHKETIELLCDRLDAYKMSIRELSKDALEANRLLWSALTEIFPEQLKSRDLPHRVHEYRDGRIRDVGANPERAEWRDALAKLGEKSKTE